ncbi:radical SAM protein [Polyangium spumosum]|uniref:Radical SAM core domain-containing protein n=1 Tax=Polyangium spumosum TaxID=889282 RepID=A0A6N7PMZ9_9BACT|nr:radical SAM protein [Polyangium spumosum]MRG91660.1 hypothetical protein [Polyangium spumosum]
MVDELLTKTVERFGVSFCVVGSMAAALSGLPVTPRDIDLYLPNTIDVRDFSNDVLEPLGYSELSDEVWRREGQSLALSSPVLAKQRNPIFGHFEAELGWHFSDVHWRTVELPSGHRTQVPGPCLSMLLKLKSIGDKIWLVANLDSAPDLQSFWREMLTRDIGLLELELMHAREAYQVEPVVALLRERERPAEVALALRRAGRFAREVLCESDARTVLDDWLRLLHFFTVLWDLPQNNEDMPNGYAERLELVRARGDVQLLVDRQSGVVIERTDGPRGDVPAAPTFLHVQLNASCNMKCAHCPYPMTGESLDLDVLQARLSEAAQVGIVQVNFGEGAEALLYDRLSSALRMTRAHGMIPNLSTNLSLEPSDELWSTILECCGAVAVSIDEYHFKSLARDGIPSAIARRIKRLVTGGVSVTINTVYETGKLEDIAHIVDQVADLGAATLCLIRRMHDDGPMYRPTPIGDLRVLHGMISRAVKRQLVVTFHATDPIAWILPLGDRRGPLAEPYWAEARDTIFLDPLGGLRPSALSQAEERILGSIPQAWCSPVFYEFRARTRTSINRFLSGGPP